MDPLPWGAVFDISSDEEPTALEESRACHDDNDDYNWWTRLLESVDKVKELKDGRGAAIADVVVDDDDDDDEVVVVGEYNPPKSKAKSKPWKQMKDEDDADCVVLDGDPDKPVSGVNHSAATSKDDGGCCSDTGAVDDDDHDVLVVGEKGQVACRDYPHPRHLCVELPFNSTPHERHCHLCHCYVCDSVAPCVQWGTGMSLIDHCHATDKQEMWKTQREIFRIGKVSSSTPLPVAVTQCNQVASLDVLQSTTNSSSRIQVTRLQSQTFRPTTIRACSSSSRLGIPNHLLGSSQGKNGVMPHSVSRHVLGVRKNLIRHDRNPTISNLVRQTSSNTISRSPGVTGGALAIRESVYGSLDNASCPPLSNYTRNVVSLDILKEVPSSRQDVLPNVIAGSFISSQPNIGGAFLDTAASISEVYSQSITPPSNNQNVHQLGNQGHTVTGSGLSPLDFSWDDLLGTSDQQTSLGGIQLQGTGSSYEPSAVRQFSSQTAGAETTQFQYDIEGYNNCFVNQDVSVVSDGCSSHDLNFISPETPAVDAESCIAAGQSPGIETHRRSCAVCQTSGNRMWFTSGCKEWSGLLEMKRERTEGTAVCGGSSGEQSSTDNQRRTHRIVPNPGIPFCTVYELVMGGGRSFGEGELNSPENGASHSVEVQQVYDSCFLDFL